MSDFQLDEFMVQSALFGFVVNEPRTSKRKPSYEKFIKKSYFLLTGWMWEENC